MDHSFKIILTRMHRISCTRNCVISMERLLEKGITVLCFALSMKCEMVTPEPGTLCKLNAPKVVNGSQMREKTRFTQLL